MPMLVSIDNGGTLTDACVIHGDRVFHAKTLTTPHDLTMCFVEVLKEASRKIYGEPCLEALLEQVDYIRYSTTQGTNAVVQRIGPRLGLIVRQGAGISRLIRNDDERELFEAMVGDRVGSLDLGLDDEAFEANITTVINHLMSQGANRIVVSLGGETLIDDESRVKRVTLLRYPRHLLGAVPILYSHQLSDDGDDARRTWSGLLNSFLHPAMERFLYNAENVLRDYRAKNPLLIFCNDGTSSRVAKTIALKTWGSGPRGGMEGAKAIAQHYDRKTIVTMDIGGTTTDIGMVDHARVREQRWGELESIAISFPLSEVESLGAGGSSVFRVVSGEIVVGPESVGSTPGPACFGRGGRQATITDAYLLMGIFDPDSYFGGNLRLDIERARAAVQENVAGPLGASVEEAVLMMERAYQEKIAHAMAPQVKHPANTTLLAFGGAGPIAACGVAQHLGIGEIIVPRLAAVFSAFGIGFSDIAHTYDAALPEISAKGLQETLERLAARAERDMFAEGFDLSECAIERALTFARDGVEAAHHLNGEIRLPEGLRPGDNPRVLVRATKPIPHFSLRPLDTAPASRATALRTRQALGTRVTPGRDSALVGHGRVDLPLFRLEDMSPGMYADGPAIIEEEYFTCRVPEGWRFAINDNLDIVLQHTRSRKK
ncbi:MAG: hydantoinase/oxoprolinase family protein [Betaproteobacteria bacterium]|nr:hydantoinase/oxoprolinase family protein [Betaproteobacteria bacterium]